jgi:hypothetical protein
VTWLALAKDEIEVIVESLLARARADDTPTGDRARALAAQLRPNGNGSGHMSPDEQEALSRRYGNQVIVLVPLSSGRVAVFGSDRGQLRGYCDRAEDVSAVLRVWGEAPLSPLAPPAPPREPERGARRLLRRR